MAMDRISTWLWKAGLDPKVWRGRLQRRARANKRPAASDAGKLPGPGGVEPGSKADERDGKRLLRMAPNFGSRPVIRLSRHLPLEDHAAASG